MRLQYASLVEAIHTTTSNIFSLQPNIFSPIPTFDIVFITDLDPDPDPC